MKVLKRAKKSLGQNFLIDKNILNQIVNLGKINNNDTIIEVGSGTGNLTQEILKKQPKNFTVIEKDINLVKILKTKFGNKIEIINEDILKFTHNKYNNKRIIIFGNLPYNISTQILINWIKIEKLESYCKKFILLFQKEVADRIVAKENTKNYGRLSRLNEREIIAGARIDVAPYKKDPQDFVLWKPSEINSPGWESPWGRGRPGWHIECSAMSREHLGENFDIHGGGADLIFPHHENELAQSTCAFGERAFAKYWMHNGYLMIEGEKMSKSLGNFYTVHQLLEEFPGEAVRLHLLQTQYRQPLDFSKVGIAQARSTLDRWYRISEKVGKEAEIPEILIKALSDDLNTPQAITELHKLSSTNVAGFVAGARFLGFLNCPTEEWFQWQPPSAGVGFDDAEIALMLEERAQARKNKDFSTSDKIRDKLAAQGIVLEDGASGTTWRRR